MREQLRERYASLTQKIENPEHPAVELGNAYGEMGKLLMAAEYLEAAEPAFSMRRRSRRATGAGPTISGTCTERRGDPAKSAASFEQALQLAA